MADSALLALVMPPAVHAKPAVTSVNPDGRNSAQSERQKRGRRDDGNAEGTHPIPNTQGQITGKVIDTTA